eukprot:c9118_g1_i1 orf=222-1196(+)
MERFDNFSIENLKMEKDAAIRLKDDLVAQLRVMKKRLQEAEEEQYKAEEDTASLRAELEVLQRREEHQNIIAPSATSEQYYLLQQEVATLKAELQNALRLLQQEQRKVANEQEHVADLMSEREQLKIALSEAQIAQEGHEISVAKFSDDALKEKDYQLRELASMVERLENGRQKLLAEIDVQSIEIERLFMENDNLGACLKEASNFTDQWEHQVQDCLQENANLRAELSDLRTKLALKANKNHGGSSDTDKENESFKLELELSKAKEQAEALRAQVLQLSADLNRAMQHMSSLNWLYRPVLSNIENRLLQLKQHGNYNDVKLTV